MEEGDRYLLKYVKKFKYKPKAFLYISVVLSRALIIPPSNVQICRVFPNGIKLDQIRNW